MRKKKINACELLTLEDAKAVLAEKVVQENRVDMVSLSRGLLADPEWPNKAQEGRVDEIRRCVFCCNCLKSLFDGLGTRCSVNPEVGRERFIAKYQPFAGLV